MYHRRPPCYDFSNYFPYLSSVAHTATVKFGGIKISCEGNFVIHGAKWSFTP